MKKLLCLVGLMALTFTSRAEATVIADIVFVVDESGSMGSIQTNLRNNIGLFAQILSAGGVDATYGLVGYGSSTVRPRQLTDLTTPAAFATAAQSLLINGGTEPAYEAIMAALNGGPTNSLGFSFRPGAVKNVIIATDEQSSGDLAGASWGNVDSLLSSNDALLNGILTDFSARTISNGGTLGNLVLGHGGQVFSLTTFNTNDQAVINAFVTDFANRKLEEIINQGGIPEPTSAVVFGVMFLSAGAFNRRVSRRK